MDIFAKIAWGALAAIHLSPAMVAFAPQLTRKLYGVDSQGHLGLLLTHRGALFAAIVALCVFALFDPGARRAASLATGFSVVSFLVYYARAGFPAGALRTVAIVDVVALAPLAVVLADAWLRRT